MKLHIFPSSQSFRIFATSVMALVHVSITSGAQIVFAPSDAQTDRNGNSSFTVFGYAEERFQQVYDASVFSTLGPTGAGYISGVFFRVDDFTGRTFETTLSSLQLNLSTTAKAADGLSSDFTDNIGVDDMAVVGPQSIVLRGVPGGFIVRINFLDHPFFYDPSQGNLLLDFRVLNNPDEAHGLISPMDAFDVAGDSVSSVFGHGPGGSVTGETSTLGLATLFSFTPVPEPSTFALLSLGGLLAVAFGWTRLHKE